MGKKIAQRQEGRVVLVLDKVQGNQKAAAVSQRLQKTMHFKRSYPREPKKKFEGSNKTYYHMKDLKIL